MDVLQCTPLVERFKAFDDPRDPRGVRHPWWVILTIAAAARMAGQKTDRAVALWAKHQRSTLARYLPLYHGRPPSQSTFQRAFCELDVEAFEALVSEFIQGHEPAPGDGLQGVALDGKGVNGATRHGAPTHLLAAVSHRTANVLRQCNVGEKTNEIPVARELLAGWDLTGAVVTGAAMHCQRETAAQIGAQGGHYLLQVKDNQPTLREHLAAAFTADRRGPHPLQFDKTATLDAGHGRVESRALEATAALNEYLQDTWPGVGQVIRRVCRRAVRGQRSEEAHYWITSLSAAEASPADLEALCRGHWTIENRVHYCRDVTFGEDAANQRCGSAPQARAALTNAVMTLLRAHGVRYLPDAFVYFQAHPAKALQALGCRRL
jgi:predicted transposase YbfD/YdcC